MNVITPAGSIQTDCNPACAPVSPAPLPSVSPGSTTVLGSSCANPLYVEVCPPLPIEYTRGVSVLCDPNTGQEVFVSVSWPETSGPGVAPSFDYYVAGGVAYTGNPAALVACPTVEVASSPEPMCDAGTTFWRWYVTKAGKPTGVFFDTSLAGAPYVPANAPTPGVCSPCQPYTAAQRGLQASW